MSVVAELTISPEEFELGRILALESGSVLTLEEMVPLGQRFVPLVWVHDEADSFAETVRGHPSAERLQEVDCHGNRRLYALEWHGTDDALLAGIVATDGRLLSATGTADTWRFEIRFPSHDALAAFHEHCEGGGVSVTLDRVFNPTTPDAGPFYGLTDCQREALVLAVTVGYYDLPREASTATIADELGISDQAVTERLRRGIVNLVEHTLLVDTPDD
jgi:predicted DNA binding protein